MNKTILLVIALFIVGFIFVSTTHTSSVVEGFGQDIKNIKGVENCPNLLIKKDDKYYLYNSKAEFVPGANPIQFNHLEEYTEFMNWVRSKGLRCPVLYLQQTYDTQGAKTFRVLDRPDQPNVGLPPLRQAHETQLYDAGHDEGSMPSFDPLNQYIGDYTPLDAMFHSKLRVSDNPMDPQWGGVKFTEEAVASGKYDDNIVRIYVP